MIQSTHTARETGAPAPGLVPVTSPPNARWWQSIDDGGYGVTGWEIEPACSEELPQGAIPVEWDDDWEWVARVPADAVAPLAVVMDMQTEINNLRTALNDVMERIADVGTVLHVLERNSDTQAHRHDKRRRREGSSLPACGDCPEDRDQGGERS